jgi:hypothetical protein
MRVLDPLQDGHGRLISSLRVSVTDRCNFYGLLHELLHEALCRS